MSTEQRETIADAQHAIWAHWMRYMLSCGKYTAEGWLMPPDKFQRWFRQMETPYSELTERERESDREQADRVITSITPRLAIEKEQWLAILAALNSQAIQVAADNAHLRHQLDKVSPITGETSDGYHTFNELYKHRCILFACLLPYLPLAFKTRKNDSGEMWPGWFIAGAETDHGQITYHLPDELWDLLPIMEIERNAGYDGHTPNDVIDRLTQILKGNAQGSV